MYESDTESVSCLPVSGTASQDAPVSVITPSRQVILQVGDRRFTTIDKTMVEESRFFESLLSERWDNAQVDGSYFIDADPGLFEHILRYLRRGILPVFYDKSKGHDHALYLALLEEAKYFQITRLAKWFEEKRYLQAVKVAHSAKELDAADAAETTGADVEVEYHPAWKTEKVYICPRGIRSHRGNRDACGRQCRNAQGDADDIYEDDKVLKMLVVRKETVFNQDICIEGR